MTPETRYELTKIRIAALHLERDNDRMLRAAHAVDPAPPRGPLVRSILRRLAGPAVA